MTTSIPQPHLIGKIYPDGSLTIGYNPHSKMNKPERDYEREHEAQYDYYDTVHKDYRGTEVTTHRFFNKKLALDRLVKSQESSQKSESYGSKGITSYGKKSVTNIALLIQEKYGIGRVGFYTATIPDLDVDDLKWVNANWGEIVRRFFQELKRVHAREGVPFDYASVTEIQEKRFDSTSKPYPHLHWVANCKKHKKGKFHIHTHELRYIWKRVLLKVVSLREDGAFLDHISFNASIDGQLVKKTCSGYLGKYLSKGCKVVEAMKEAGYVDFPKQWWSASMQMKKALARCIVHIPLHGCIEIFYNVDSWLEMGYLSWAEEIYINHAEREFQVGVAAKIPYNRRRQLILGIGCVDYSKLVAA